jgi:hypothetical protein
MLVELDAVNHALGEHPNGARGGFYLRVLIHFFDRRSQFVPLTDEDRHLFRDTKSACATCTEERGG